MLARAEVQEGRVVLEQESFRAAAAAEVILQRARAGLAELEQSQAVAVAVAGVEPLQGEPAEQELGERSEFTNGASSGARLSQRRRRFRPKR